MNRQAAFRLSIGLLSVAAVTLALRRVHVANATTIALTFLLVVLFVASLGDLFTAIATSTAAALAFNYFFLPPFGTLTIADSRNWIAFIAFLVVSLVASRLAASARARAEEALEHRHGVALANQRAELASALLASLGHDLRTPLTAIRTAVSNLDMPALPEGQRREQAGIAAEQLKRLARLFDEILDMARIDSGMVQPRREWTTPAEIVEAAMAYAAPLVSGHDVRIDAREDRAVEVDPRLAASALAHLLENAVRYAGDGPIAVEAWTDAEGLRVEVRDEGQGIRPGELERLFEPFYRGETFRKQVPGTGIGLTITRGLVAADGGRVWADALAPRGARFSIAVPAPTRPVAAE